jgi:uncharacterized protein (DUF2236 family)
MGSLTSHLTVGDFLKKPSLQSNVDIAASMLPWKVKSNMDMALDTINRKRLEVLQNSSEMLDWAIADCKASHSVGTREFELELMLSDTSETTAPRRTF